MECFKTYPYDKVYMYDKVNNNTVYVIQKSLNSVYVHIHNGRNSIMQLSVYELEQELKENNLVIGKPNTIKLLYGK